MTVDPKKDSPTSNELRRLDREILKVIHGVAYAVIGILFAYVAWFVLIQRQPVSTSADAWGAFGDYFGGLLNPLIAFTALYWLTRSVRLQKEELAETRTALENSAQAQRDQVAVSSWTALINANTARIQHLQYLLAQVKQRAAELQSKNSEVFIGNEYETRKAIIQAVQSEAAPIEAELSERATRGATYEGHLNKLAGQLHGSA